MIFTIKPAKIEKWGYEITSKGYHNIAPTIEAARQIIIDRFGPAAKIKIK